MKANSLRVMRDRQAAAEDVLDAVASLESRHGSAAMLAVTTTVSSYPTSATSFYACNPQFLTGDDTEGATPTFESDSATVVYAYNMGSAIPPNGTKIVIHATGGRWCFRYDG